MSTLTINLTNVQPLDTILTGLSALGYSGNAGLYIKVNATADGFEFAAAGGGGSTFADNAFQIYDNVDNTKILAFQASGITTGTTRTLTVPDASGTIALTSDLSSYLPLSGGTLTGNVSLGAYQLTVHNIRPDASDGLLLESNNGTDIALLGAGNTANGTWYGNHNFEGGTIQLGKLDTTLGKLVLFGSTSGQVTIQPNAIAGTNIVLTAPATTGTIALTSDLSSYQAIITGTDTRVLFFDGTNNVSSGSGLTYNKTTETLTLGYNVRVGGSTSGIQLRAISSTQLGIRNNADSGYVGLASGNIEIKGSSGRISSESGGLGLYPNSGFIFINGTTSSFPALKRSSTELQVRLADDSAFAPIQASQLTISAGNIITDTTTGMKIGTATSQKLGFWNATPVVQQTTAVSSATLVPNLGTDPIQSGDTFDGYTLQQVVKALRNTGILA